MLTPGLERCPSCGARLKKNTGGMSVRDVFWLSAYILGIAMIPILLAIAIGIACTLFGR
jgi:hypothetical protein